MKRRSVLAVIFTFLFAATAIAQGNEDKARAFYRLTDAAPEAFNRGEFETARGIAVALLLEAESWPKDWNYGNAIHVANLVLGRIELREKKKKKAIEYLLAAGRTPGSPQLNTFGPDMLFAKELLKVGEKDAVLQYLDLCAKFWKMKQGVPIDTWKAQIEKGETPDFGPNVRRRIPVGNLG